ncbi:hypothetical protein Tco_0632665, partial [Tanacetum coccineum]
TTADALNSELFVVFSLRALGVLIRVWICQISQEISQKRTRDSKEYKAEAPKDQSLSQFSSTRAILAISKIKPIMDLIVSKLLEGDLTLEEIQGLIPDNSYAES